MSRIKVRFERFLCADSILSNIFFAFSGNNVFTDPYNFRGELIKAQIQFTKDDIKEMKYMRDTLDKYIHLFESNNERWNNQNGNSR